MKINKFNESSDIISQIESGEPSWKWIQDLRKTQEYVEDGVWDISDIEVFNPQYPTTKKWVPGKAGSKGVFQDIPNAEKIIEDYLKSLKDFIKRNPNFVIADAYQTEHPFFFFKKSTVSVQYIGSGFNHGSNNIIDNCPKRILICGEDD